eukprot:Tamp_07489.p1 GENE.Tamp_07489~~Tamp_07489.p1  ORF type:complete len:482 (+),score=152.56 Tamp_07489:332-1777(+)
MKSPEYTKPVMDFIDEHCPVFDGEEEAPHELQKLHAQFVEKVFGLLEGFLSEIGVSQEEFSEACQHEISSGGRNAFVFQQIMAADDFQAFNKMMVQRQRQLSYESLKQIQRMQLAAGMGGDSGAKGQEPAQSGGALAHDGGDDEDEEEMRQLEEALRMSSMTFIDDDPELAEALRISAECEQLQPAGMTEQQLLEAAIQESIKASVSASPPAPPPPASPDKSEEVPMVYDEAKSPYPAPKEDIVYDEAQLQEARTMPLVTDAELSAAKQQHQLAVVEHAIAVNEAIARAEADEPADSAAPVEEAQVKEAQVEEAQAPVAAQPSQPATGAEQAAPAAPSSGALPPIASSSLGALPPLTGTRGGNAGTSLTLSSMTAQEMDKSEKKRAKALEKERRENEQALLLKQARSQSAGPEVLGLTPEEIAQRKAQLETQRQRILAAKKKEREVSLSLCSLLWLSVYHASLRVSRGRLAMSDARCVGRR